MRRPLGREVPRPVELCEGACFAALMSAAIFAWGLVIARVIERFTELNRDDLPLLAFVATLIPAIAAWEARAAAHHDRRHREWGSLEIGE